MTDDKAAPDTRVFVSYAHERGSDGVPGHRERALKLAQSLRNAGIDARIDQYLEHDPPIWPRWMLDEIHNADFVLCLASPAYKARVEDPAEPAGRGAQWEGIYITEALYHDIAETHRKFIAVVMPPCTAADIPDVLRPVGATYYLLPEDDEDLYRRLTRQPRVIPRPMGSIVRLDEQASERFFLTN